MFSWYWPGPVQNGGDVFFPVFTAMAVGFVAFFGLKHLVERCYDRSKKKSPTKIIAFPK